MIDKSYGQVAKQTWTHRHTHAHATEWNATDLPSVAFH